MSRGRANEQLEAQLLLADVLLDASRPRDAVAICQRLLVRRSAAQPAGRRRGRSSHGAGRSHDRRPAQVDRRAERPSRSTRPSTRKPPRSSSAARRRRTRGFSTTSAAPIRRRASCRTRSSSSATSTSGAGGLPTPATRTNVCRASRPTTIARVRALWRLAHVYEAQATPDLGADSYLELLARFPKQALVQDGRIEARLASWRPRSSRGPSTRSIVADRPEPPTPLPLFRRWHWQPPDNLPVKTLGRLRRGCRRSIRAACFWSRRRGCGCSTRSSGAPRWVADLGGPAGLGRLSLGQADRGDCAADRGARAFAGNHPVAIRRGQGRRKDARRARPVREPGRGRDRPAAGGSDLSGFQLANGRVFCLRNRSELIAIDGDTGAPRLVVLIAAGRDQSQPLDRRRQGGTADRQAESTAGALEPETAGRSIDTALG